MLDGSATTRAIGYSLHPGVLERAVEGATEGNRGTCFGCPRYIGDAALACEMASIAGILVSESARGVYVNGRESTKSASDDRSHPDLRLVHPEMLADPSFFLATIIAQMHRVDWCTALSLGLCSLGLRQRLPISRCVLP